MTTNKDKVDRFQILRRENQEKIKKKQTDKQTNKQTNNKKIRSLTSTKQRTREKGNFCHFGSKRGY